MPALSENEIARLLIPYLGDTSGSSSLQEPQVPADLYFRLSAYLDLLIKWNARTNLTAIRDPQEIVCRHFGESLFAGRHLGVSETLLDLGSGAGFPGLPIALLYPQVRVTLAESQNKKATFLREVVRTLELPNVEVWAARAEALPPTLQFHTVALRAVDNMEAALLAARTRVAPGGQLAVLSTLSQIRPNILPEGRSIPLPNSESGVLYLQTA